MRCFPLHTAVCATLWCSSPRLQSVQSETPQLLAGLQVLCAVPSSLPAGIYKLLTACVGMLQPQDAYGLEKLASEELAVHYSKDFGIECRIARFHNIYGPYGTWKGGREKAPAAFCRKVRSHACCLSAGPDSVIWACSCAACPVHWKPSCGLSSCKCTPNASAPAVLTPALSA